MRLLIATRNEHKLAEIRSIFASCRLTLLGSGDVPGLPEVEEDGVTFAENAVKKAVAFAAASGLPAMADDSGLEVKALGGMPGVRSARYAGEPPDYAANNRKLVAALRGVDARSARFRCAIALAWPDGRNDVVEGKCEGAIAVSPRGPGGFGYDPLFVPAGYDLTFAEMAPDLKNRISHRAVALELARAKWSDALAAEP